MTPRLGVALGLLAAGAVTVWWLTATRAALLGNGDAAAVAIQALFVLSLVRPMLVSVLGCRSAAEYGYGAGLRTALPVVTAAWPLVAIVWLASPDSLAHALIVEAALAGYALLVPLVGHVLWRMAGPRSWVPSVATVLGAALSCGVWLMSDSWQPAVGG